MTRTDQRRRSDLSELSERDRIRKGNEKLVVSMVETDEEIERRNLKQEMLTDLVREVREAKCKLHEKIDDLEKLSDLTAGREFTMMQVERECEALKKTVDILKFEVLRLRAERDRN